MAPRDLNNVASTPDKSNRAVWKRFHIFIKSIWFAASVTSVAFVIILSYYIWRLKVRVEPTMINEFVEKRWKDVQRLKRKL